MARRSEGFRIVPGRRATDPFYLRFSHGGRRFFLSTRTRDPRLAERNAAAIYAYVTSGRVAAPALTDPSSLKEAVARYLAGVEATGSHERYAMQHVHMRAHLLRHFTTLAQLEDAGMWQDYVELRAGERVLGSTIGKELSTLRQLATWCKDRNLIQKVPTVRGPRRTSDYQALCLDPDQIEAVLAALPERVERGPSTGRPIRARYILAWETSLRPATLARLLVDDYDSKLKRLRIRDSADKARFGRELPLTERAWRTIEAVLPKSGLIFGAARPGTTLKTAARVAGLPEPLALRVSPKTFRHSRVTQLASATTDLRGIAYLAGHRNLTTTSRYVHGDVRAAERVLQAVAQTRPSPT
jgi:site-specific recombinase XerD